MAHGQGVSKAYDTHATLLDALSITSMRALSPEPCHPSFQKRCPTAGLGSYISTPRGGGLVCSILSFTFFLGHGPFLLWFHMKAVDRFGFPLTVTPWEPAASGNAKRLNGRQSPRTGLRRRQQPLRLTIGDKGVSRLVSVLLSSASLSLSLPLSLTKQICRFIPLCRLGRSRQDTNPLSYLPSGRTQ